MQQAGNWHKTEQICACTWRIIEANGINCYLLTGSERALLIDTGNGVGNLGEVVRGLTDLPVTVALTHGHCDHVGGRGWFDVPCHIHEADRSPATRILSSRFAARIGTAKWAGAKDFPEQPFNAGYTAMTDGVVFELGGRSVSVMHTPGHTRGSVIFLDDRCKLMFVGDNLSHSDLWMHLPDAVSIEEWIPIAQRILKLSEKYTVYSGHGEQPFDVGLIVSQIECAGSLVKKYSRNGLLPFRKKHTAPDGQLVISYNPRNVRAHPKRRVRRPTQERKDRIHANFSNTVPRNKR